jgi:hypothetical protein
VSRADVAVAYARFGLAIVLTEPNGKRPLRWFAPHGATDATRDEDRIRRGLAREPHANIAGRVGENRIVLDVDARRGGHDELRRLVASHGRLPTTPLQATAGGGLHYVFRHFDPAVRLRGELASGLEVITGNRLHTMAPSSCNGRRYEWLTKLSRTPLAEPPRWLAEMMRAPPEPQRAQRTGEVDAATREKRARAYAAKLEPAISGQCGHRATFVAAQKLARGFDLDEETALDVLREWNRNCDPAWTEGELRRKVREAIRRGSMAFGALLVQKRSA